MLPVIAKTNYGHMRFLKFNLKYFQHSMIIEILLLIIVKNTLI